MRKELEEKALKALERQQKTYKRQNEWTASHYERQTVTMPLGTKDRLKAVGVSSFNGYINELIQEDLKRREDPKG